MENEWILIYKTPKPFEAELIKNMLEAEHIRCVLVNKKDSSYLFGYVELYVPVEEGPQAATLIEDF
jgi:hypothetical protein